ncbi:MAG TPA: tRNA (N6-threonylcarbamoyladenosine(37)-N6)-methyltransferase TrmO [Candidatus Hydrogenedentes bacterium]|nr:tRNA (N6-threonylcarbamoyladenosine(37)-N6)-methyltransferase TrmO [Candidatus Hydrogenedentota bacterium]
MKEPILDRPVIQTVEVRPIGFVRSPYKQHDDVVHTHDRWTNEEAAIQLSAEHAAGLKGLTGYSHIIILFWIHRANEWKMPKGHHKPPGVNVFATRMPRRPVPIGISVVELIDFSPETGLVRVHGLDALDETPVLDIKPYIPHFDSIAHATVPDWVRDHIGKHHHGGARGHHGQDNESTGNLESHSPRT